MKAKRLQSKGRRVSDLTANGLNAFQGPEERRVNNLPSFRFLMALMCDKDRLFDFDFSACYRQIPYAKNCWGLVSYCYNGYAFIDLSLTFGLGKAAKVCVTWSTDMQFAFEKRWPELFTPLSCAAFANTFSPPRCIQDRLCDLGSSCAPTALPSRLHSSEFGQANSKSHEVSKGKSSMTTPLGDILPSEPPPPLSPPASAVALQPVTHTKQMVYVDDNLCADQGPCQAMINSMKAKVIEILDNLRVTSDLKEGPGKKQTKYLGWLLCLERK